MVLPQILLPDYLNTVVCYIEIIFLSYYNKYIKYLNLNVFNKIKFLKDLLFVINKCKVCLVLIMLF